MNFGYVSAVNNLSLYEKNCDWILDYFYRDGSKSWIFVLIYVPLFIGLCDNVTTRTILITSI